MKSSANAFAHPTRYALRTTHYSLLTTHYSLLLQGVARAAWRQMERLCQQTFEHLRGRQLAPEHAIVLLRHAEQGVDGVHHRADGQIVLDVEGGRHIGTRGECREIERQPHR